VYITSAYYLFTMKIIQEYTKWRRGWG